MKNAFSSSSFAMWGASCLLLLLALSNRSSAENDVLLDVINDVLRETGITHLCGDAVNETAMFAAYLTTPCNRLRQTNRAKFGNLFFDADGLTASLDGRSKLESQPMWDFVIYNENALELKKRLQRMNFTVSPIFILESVNNRKAFSLHKLCPEVGQKANLGLTKNIFSWNRAGKRLRKAGNALFCPGFAKGAVFHVSVTGLPPFLAQKGPKTFSGTDIEVLKVFGEKLGFTIACERQRSWGNEIGETGKWSGVIGMVMEGNSQAGTSHISLLRRRYRVNRKVHGERKCNYSKTLEYRLNFFLVDLMPK